LYIYKLIKLSLKDLQWGLASLRKARRVPFFTLFLPFAFALAKARAEGKKERGARSGGFFHKKNIYIYIFL
jgi:hypothetical protein